MGVTVSFKCAKEIKTFLKNSSDLKSNYTVMKLLLKEIMVKLKQRHI